MIRFAALPALALGLFAASPAQAAPAPRPNSPLATAVVQCRGVADEQARLRCYDQAAAAMGTALDSGAMVALDRESLRSTRRSLFGLGVKLPFLSDEDKEDEPSEIVAKVTSVNVVGMDKWSLGLDTGAVWQTTESLSRFPPPRRGDTVTIRKGFGGGFMLDFRGRKIRIRRTH